MSNSDLPRDRATKLAYLRTASQHGEALKSLLTVGGSVEPARQYVAAHPDLISVRKGKSLAIRFGDLVYWDILIDGDDCVLGYLASGFQPLMAELGIDFSGRPYDADNG